MLPELSRDIMLADELFELFDRRTRRRGRGGHSTTYIASERKVVYRYHVYNPGSGEGSSGEEVLQIPENILTEEELRNFVSQHQPGWI